MKTIQTLITDHLDIWTAAETEKKSGRGRSSGNTGSVYGIKKLRELILELAVRGKLVPQDANDEPAVKLLERIQKENAKLLAEGMLKKEKPLECIDEQGAPFDLPSGWTWGRVGDTGQYINGLAFKPEDWGNVGRPIIRIQNLSGRNQEFNRTDRNVDDSVIVRQGDILVSWSATLDVFYWTATEEGVLNQHIFRVIPNGLILKSYLYWLLKAAIREMESGDHAHGLVMTHVNRGPFLAHIIAMPPLLEQHRIVAKVDEIMALCDQLETQHSNAAVAHEKLVSHLLGTLTQSQSAEDFSANWQRIAAHFDTLFTTEASIDALKQTLLQLAVMGKLVPQDPNDEPASELLKRIQTEKAKLITEGKIKKDKPLPPITDEEKPFELPIEWEWVRLGTITEIKGGKRVSNGYKLLTQPTLFIYIRVSDMKNGSIDDSNLHYIDSEMREKISRYIITKDDIYMTIVGATIGKCGIVPEKFDQMNLTENAARLTPWEGSEKLFLYKCLEGSVCQSQFFDKTKQVGVQKMALNRLASTIVPLPPTAEQRRIVAKVDELMNICDQLKTRLTEANQVQKKLADVLVEQTVN